MSAKHSANLRFVQSIEKSVLFSPPVFLIILIVIQESLKRMRQFDNKILYALNTPNSGLNANSEVTEYESCAFYFEKFRNNCLLRRNFIIDCVGKQNEFVNKIKKRMEEDENDVLSAKFYSVASKKVCRWLYWMSQTKIPL